MKLRSKNISTEGLESAFLTASCSAGAVTLAVTNNDGFIDDQYLMIGEMGHERTEIVKVNAVVVPGTALTITATEFGHDADTQVYILKYDKVRFYRSITGITGAYAQLGTDVVMDVDNDTLETVYDDIAGLSSYYYKVSFYGTFDDTETDLSDPIAGDGYPRGTAGSLINEFFEEVSDTTQSNMSIAEALGLMNEVNDDIISQSRRPYRFLKTSALLNTTANASRIPLPANLAKYDRVVYTSDSDSMVAPYRRISLNELEMLDMDTSTAADDGLEYVSIDESTDELIIYPKAATSQVGKIKIYYWKNFEEISSLADVLETPNTRIYKLFLMGRYFRKRGIKEPAFLAISDRYLSDYNTEIVKLQRSNRLDMGTPMNMKPDTGHSRGLRV